MLYFRYFSFHLFYYALMLKDRQITALINKVMKGLRIIKKYKHLQRSVESQSRQIITNIFTNIAQADKLQLGTKEWSSQHTMPLIINKNTPTKIQQPLKNLLQLLEHLSKDFYIDICSFIFLSKDNIYIAIQDKFITIKKIKYEKSKLKYWFSHIYFTRLRHKLAESLLQENFNAERQVIHTHEEKQYMPSHVSGKKSSSTLVREIKISRSSIDRKQGEGQRQQFCVGYYNNGAQQLFNFSQVLSFVQYPFNLSQISYFKILTKQKQRSSLINTYYSKKNVTIEELTLLQKLKRLLKRQQRWMVLKDEFQEMKNNFIRNEQYQSYSRLQMFEMISFLQVKIFVQVKELSLEWTIDINNCVLLSNALIYKFVQINKVSQITDGLVTLYQKCQTIRERNKKIQDEETHFHRFKKIKSEEKYIGDTTSKLPLLNWQKRSNEKTMTNALKIKSKANSCVLRIGFNKLNV